jgi:hypothetical protein
VYYSRSHSLRLLQVEWPSPSSSRPLSLLPILHILTFSPLFSVSPHTSLSAESEDSLARIDILVSTFLSSNVVDARTYADRTGDEDEKFVSSSSVWETKGEEAATAIEVRAALCVHCESVMLCMQHCVCCMCVYVTRCSGNTSAATLHLLALPPHTTNSLQAKSRKLKAIERRVAAMTSHSFTVARQMAAAIAGTQLRRTHIRLQLCLCHYHCHCTEHLLLHLLFRLFFSSPSRPYYHSKNSALDSRFCLFFVVFSFLNLRPSFREDQQELRRGETAQ